MLKQGLFKTPKGYTYSVFEIEEKGFYRLDITEEGATFQTEPDKVKYSIFKRKKAFEYGDRTLYEEYKGYLMECGYQRGTTEKESYWESGKFRQKFVTYNQSSNFVSEYVKEDGVFYSSTLLFKGYTLTTFCVSRVYDVKLEPMNFIEYEEVSLQKKATQTVDTPYYPLKLLKAKYDIAHLDNENYYVPTTVEEARKYLKAYKESDFPLRGFDTETTGLDINLYGTDKMVGIILAWSPHDAAYFPFRMEQFDNLPLDFLDELVEVVNSLSDITVAHNKKFDEEVMMAEGKPVRIKWCTMLLSFIINPIIEKGAHALKSLIYKLNGKVYLELDDIFVSSKMINFAVLPIDIVKLYACPDGTNVICLFQELLKQLPADNYNLLEVECALSHLKAEQEFYGVRVDVERYMKQYENCNYILDTLLKAFKAMTRLEANINSSDVLRDLIYNKLRCPVILRTKTGLASTSSAAIKKLANKKADKPYNITQDIVDLNGNVIIKAKDLSESKYPVLLILSKYREYAKLKTAFYARFERTMKTGRVFFWINQNGAASGRQSSPMHQLPPELKDCILSDSDDHKFWGPDYSQVELRMISYLAGETELNEMCKNPDNDIHRVIGSLISNKEMWAITPEERSMGKRRNFGVVYLISEYGLAGQIKGPGYTKEDVSFCKKQLDAFYYRFKRIKRYLAENRVKVETRGYMETAILKRRRFFKEIFNPDITSRKKASLIRQSNNMPVQGTAADLMKIAEVNMYYYCREKGWDKLMDNGFPRVRVMLSIHDEAIISADSSIPVEEIVEMITKCMEIEVEGAPPFFVQPAYMSCWGEHSNDACAMPIRLRDKLIEDYNRTGKSSITYDNYMEVLNKFRDDTLHNYMESLISKYGTDYKSLGDKVRHPSLTHELLGRYSKELKKLDLTHEEKIVEATKLYLQDRENNRSIAVEETPINESEREKFFEEVSGIINFDKDGNIVCDEEETTEEEYSIYDDEAYIDYTTSGKIYKAWEIADCVMLDLENLSMENANKVIAEVFKRADPNGFYRVMFIWNGKTVTANFNVEIVDIDKWSEMILSLEGGLKGDEGFATNSVIHKDVLGAESSAGCN